MMTAHFTSFVQVLTSLESESESESEEGDTQNTASAALMASIRLQFADLDRDPLFNAPKRTNVLYHGNEDNDDDDDEDDDDEDDIDDDGLLSSEVFLGKIDLSPEVIRESHERGNCEKKDPKSFKKPPDLQGQTSLFFTSSDYDERIGDHDPLLSRLHREDPETTAGPWRRLYSSAESGSEHPSFSALRYALEGYDGPTVLLIGTKSKRRAKSCERDDCYYRSILGVLAVRPWSSSGGGGGGGGTDDHFSSARDTLLFSSSAPGGGVRVVRPRRDHRSLAAVSTRLSPSLHGYGSGDGGLIVGNDRLKIPARLTDCCVMPFDGVFEPGRLLPFGHKTGHRFDVEMLELWGVGGTARIGRALVRQCRLRAKKKTERRRQETTNQRQPPSRKHSSSGTEASFHDFVLDDAAYTL